MILPKIELLTSEHNTSRRTGSVEYIAVHYTAGWDDSPGKAADNARYYAAAAEKASADFFVDRGGIVQYNPAPEKRYCWAVGAKKADRSRGGGRLFGAAKNRNTVSIELCSRNDTGRAGEPNDPAYGISEEVLARGAALARYLLAEWELPPERLIRHFDVTGKLCPGVLGWNEPGGTAEWERFRALALTIPEPPARYDLIAQLPDWARPTVRKLCDYGYLQGSGGPRDVNGRPADLDLSPDMVRLLVIQDRAGVFG